MNLVRLQDTKLTYRNMLHFYTLTTTYEDSLIYIHMKKHKISRDKLAYKGKRPILRNSKKQRKETEEDTNRWKDTPCS